MNQEEFNQTVLTIAARQNLHVLNAEDRRGLTACYLFAHSDDNMHGRIYVKFPPGTNHKRIMNSMLRFMKALKPKFANMHLRLDYQRIRHRGNANFGILKVRKRVNPPGVSGRESVASIVST